MDRRVRRDLRAVSSARRAAVNQWFFKTGPGDYGEGDRFLGIAVPDLRRIARTHQDLPTSDVLGLLRSKWHEERLLALLILVRQYARADDAANHAALRDREISRQAPAETSEQTGGSSGSFGSWGS